MAADDRRPQGFTWTVGGGIEALSAMAGIRFDRMFLDLDAIVEAYRRGTPIARERFGPDIAFGPPRWASISYGHLNCLGAELRFPEGSEVAVTPLYGSLAEGIRALKREVDFACQGRFPFYLDLRARLRAAFPDLAIPFAGFGCEGPLTTAWLLRGQDFFLDLYDDPPLAAEYVRLATESVVRYRRLLARVNGEPEFSAAGAPLADDGAAMIPPGLWPELVVPNLERYFSALTSGCRWAHIEDLTVAHLPFLDRLQIDFYDPSVSRRLSPALIRRHCGVPFHWRLNEPEYEYLSPEEAARWVRDAAAEGADRVATEVWRNNATPRAAQIVHAFVRAAAKVAAARAQRETP